MPNKKNKILVTGGGGFIGSEFVRQAIREGYRVVVVDKLTYAGDLQRLKTVKGQFKFHKLDITDLKNITRIIKKEHPQYVVHFAAESHVDRSLHSSVTPFIKTNIQGTQTLIATGKKTKLKKFIHISTDEVYGELQRGAATESRPLNPNNPYAVTKAAADFLVLAAYRSDRFPAIIARPSNTYGPWQYPEKLIPVCIIKALQNQKIPVYAKGQNVRQWLHVSDCAGAILKILKKGKIGEIYNIGGPSKRKNIEIVNKILKRLQKPSKLIQHVKDRPGHDLRYSIRSAKIARLGWRAKIDLDHGLDQTVHWAREHRPWMTRKTKNLQKLWAKTY